MGALHRGHARLIETCRAETGFVVVSIFVNPTQFGPNEDYTRYPRSEAEDLAKLSGIVLNYPSLRLTIEGHSDTSGKAEVNQALSEQRANAVRDYLVTQGLQAGSLSAQGLGISSPVADNSTAEGRQKNRRVEIIVSGEVIGTQIGR